jgi:hypothetical protein
VDERRARILALLTTGDPADSMPHRVCTASIRALQVSGAGLSVISAAGHRVVVSGTDEASQRLEDLQVTLGNGPCVEAYSTGGPVLVTDLAGERPDRWPGFVAAAYAAGIRAVFAFPLQIGAIRLGAIDFYRDKPDSLDAEALADALVVADVATLALLSTGPGAESAGGFGADGWPGTDWLAGAASVVYQASGMVRVHLDIPIEAALLRLRAYAFAEDMPISAVARLIVAKQLRLTDE